jgi:hypothetical protein
MEAQMSKSYFSSNTRILIVFVFTTLLSVVVWASTSNGARGEAGMSPAVVQTKERVLKQSSFPEEPMKVVSIKAKGKNIDVGKKFLEESDWLKSLTIKLKNLSNKPIVFFEVSLNFQHRHHLHLHLHLHLHRHQMAVVAVAVGAVSAMEVICATVSDN